MNKNLHNKKIQRIKDMQGSGTSMVSLYIPSDSNIQSYKNRMSQEISEAENIKSKKNRQNVKKAIKNVQSILSQYRTTPDNGLVIFSGIVDEEKSVEFVFDELPHKISKSKYVCDDVFHTETLEEILAPDKIFGLVVIERGGVKIGELRGSSINELYETESSVPSMHKAGGFSQDRFDRDIEKKKESFFDSARDKMNEYFLENNTPNIDGLIIGGTNITVDNFSEDIRNSLKDIIIGIYNIDVSTGDSLERLATKAESDISDFEGKEEIKNVNTFYKGLRDSSEHSVTYGDENVSKAIEYGAVDTLLISQNISSEKIESLRSDVSEIGGNTVIISDNFPKGEQFWNAFGGIGAILRYDIE